MSFSFVILFCVGSHALAEVLRCGHTLSFFENGSKNFLSEVCNLYDLQNKVRGPGRRPKNLAQMVRQSVH
jgi:hypothetical protein